jgi:Na+-driven multidrug efflux pump
MAGIMLPMVGFQIVSAGYFQAVGKSKQAMLLMVSRQILALIPAVLLLPRFFGLDGVWLALPASDFVASLITGVCISFELRRLNGAQGAGDAPKGDG